MVYLLPSLNYPDNYQYTPTETLWIITSAYIVAALHFALLMFALYNIWNYLYRQQKWRVFSLSMFYVLILGGLTIRIYVTILINVAQSKPVILYYLLPMAVKMSLGLVQILIIIEITLRVRESINTFALINRRNKLNAQSMINEVLTDQKKADRKVLILQICVLIFCISFITWIVTISVKHDNINGPNR